MLKPLTRRFDIRTWVNSHSSNVERPREAGHTAAIRDELFRIRFRECKISLNLRIDFLHKLDYG